MMGNITLRVTPETLRNQAGEVEGSIRMLEQHFNQIQDLVARSTGYWVGEAGDKAREVFESQKEDTEEVIKRFKEHPADLLAMAGVYEETEKNLESENAELATDVIA